MYKKVCCTCEVIVVLRIKPIVFLMFLLSTASLDLKVPIVEDENTRQQLSFSFPELWYDPLYN